MKIYNQGGHSKTETKIMESTFVKLKTKKGTILHRYSECIKI